MRLLAVVALASCTFHGRAGEGQGDAVTPSDDATVIDGVAPPAGWWDGAWRARRRVTVSNQDVAAPLDGFAVPIRFTGIDVSRFAAGGADVRFVTDAGVALPHEIDSWAPGIESVWVRVDVGASSTSPPPAFWMYYGNPAAPAAPAGDAVWSTFTSVHHMSSDVDATGHGHRLIPRVGVAQVTAPGGADAVGKVTAFDGNQALTLDVSTDFAFTTQMSASMWFELGTFSGDWQALLTKGDHTWRLHRAGGSQRVAFSTSRDDNSNNNSDLSTDDLAPGWHYVAFSFDRPTRAIVLDDREIETDEWDYAIHATSSVVMIGENADATNRRWKGAIDEVRISPVPRSAAWFAAEYRAVTDPAFVTLGAEQTY